MMTQQKIRFLVLAMAIILSICSFVAANLPRPSQATPQLAEQFDANLMHITTVSEAVEHVRVSAHGATDKQLLQAADKFVRQRFYHGYSTFAPAQNWLAYVSGYLWEDLRNPVIPDDILKHAQAACSQQAIVFQAIAHRMGFTVGTIGFPGHFASAVELDGSWFYFDPNKEIDAIDVPLSGITSGSQLPALYGDEGRNWKRVAELGQISLRDVDRNPAPQATLFHESTGLLSNYGWLFFTALFAGLMMKQGIARPLAYPMARWPNPRSKFFAEVFCRTFGHLRLPRRARLRAGTWSSRCRVCETRLVRLGPGYWIPIAGLERHAKALLFPAIEPNRPLSNTCSTLVREIEEAARANLSSLSTLTQGRTPDFDDARPSTVGVFPSAYRRDAA